MPRPPKREPDPVATAVWLRRFTDDMTRQGFTEQVIGALLPTVLQHLLRTDDLLTDSTVGNDTTASPRRTD